MKQRPYDVIADPTVAPRAIFISAFDSNPLAPDFEYVLKGEEANFQTGLDALAKIAKTYLGISIKQKSTALTQAKNVTVTVFDGPKPAGNVGVQINHVAPVVKGETVWTIGVGDVGNVVLRDRKHLSEDGLVIIVATVDSKTGKVLAGPDLVSRGFVYVRENESLMDGAQSIVETALDRCVDEHVRDWNSVKTRVREALSSYIYRRTKRSPMILPILMEV